MRIAELGFVTALVFSSAVALAEQDKTDETSPDRPGAWVITSSTRLLDPNHLLLATAPAVGRLLRESIEPPSSQRYCVVGNQKLIAADKFQLFPTVQCKMHAGEKIEQSYDLRYTCSASGKPDVSGWIHVEYEDSEHYQGRTVYYSLKMREIKFESKFKGEWLGETCAK